MRHFPTVRVGGGGKTALPSTLSDAAKKKRKSWGTATRTCELYSNLHMLRWGVILCQVRSFSNKVVLEGMFGVLAVVHAVL